MIIIFFFLQFLLNCSNIQALTLPNILWDSRNYLFSCPNLTINVRPKIDELYFVCPKIGLNTKEITNEEKLKVFEIAHILFPNQTYQYDNCNSTGGTEFLKCDKEDNIFYKRQEYFPRKKQFEDSFPMEPGNTYYILSTSFRTKETLNNQFNGSCLPSEDGRYFPLKLAVYLCTDEEIAADNCPVCTTFDCYLKGCGRWSDWSTTGKFFWNGTECLEKMSRKCVSNYGTCEGEKEKFVVSSDRDKCPLYKQECTPSAVLVKSSTSCSVSYLKSTVYATITQTPIISTTEIVKTVTIKEPAITASLCSPIIKTEITTVTNVEISVVTSIRNVTQVATVERFVDITYDKKFYITVAAAIIGSILAGIFVLHAIFSYCEGNRINKKVVTYSVMENQADSSKTKVDFVKES